MRLISIKMCLLKFITYLQSAPRTLRNPEHIGLKAGPANGASAKIETALPLSLALQISATKLAEFVKGEAAMIPPNNRKMMIEAVFLDSAQPI